MLGRREVSGDEADTVVERVRDYHIAIAIHRHALGELEARRQPWKVPEL